MKSGAAYNSINSAYPYLIRGTHQQTNTALLYRTPSISTSGGNLPGLALGMFSLHNRSAATCAVGIGVRIPNAFWKAGQWTDATTTYVDDTTAAQDTTTNDFPMETAATADDGHVILSRVPFNAVSYNISTASVKGTTVARAVRFSDSTGAAWGTAPTNLFAQTGLSDDMATGENIVVFAPPLDWGKSTTALGTGILAGYYAMNMRATDAPDTTAALAKAIEIYHLYFPTEGLADNGTFVEQFAMGEMMMAQDGVEGLYGDALVAFFGTLNAQNRVSAQVRAV